MQTKLETSTKGAGVLRVQRVQFYRVKFTVLDASHFPTGVSPIAPPGTEDRLGEGLR